MFERAIYGAIIFDDKDRPSAGWASVRGQPAFRIPGVGALDSEIFWWTNVKKMTTEFGSQKIKKEEYLQPTQSQLIAELGMGTGRIKPSAAVQILSEIFDRVMRMAGTEYGLKYPNEDSLVSDLYDLLVMADRPVTPEIDEALKMSYQTWGVVADRKTAGGASWMTFKRPRIRHALDVLTTPVPGAEWEFIGNDRLPAENKRVDWLLSQPQPALVMASVKNVQFEFSRVLSFGAGYLEGGHRLWMSHPELLMFSKFAKVKVEAAFLASEYAPQLVYHQMRDGGTLGLLSISNGILAECYWIALATVKSIRRRGVKIEKVYSARAVWLAASDRFHSVMPALMMDGSGFPVIGYGRGKVMIAVEPGAMKDVRACAAAAGLNSPLNIQDSIDIQSQLSS